MPAAVDVCGHSRSLEGCMVKGAGHGWEEGALRQPRRLLMRMLADDEPHIVTHPGVMATSPRFH